MNAAEGEPGSFKDRAILRANPYHVLEGALIGVHVVDASEVIVGCKRTETQSIDRLDRRDQGDARRGLARGRRCARLRRSE